MLKQDTLENYQKSYDVEWATNLPEGCPPQNILVPLNAKMYRLTLEKDKVSEDDFKTYLEKFPEKNYSGSLKNMAAGLSLLSTNEPLELFNLPLMKNFNGVAELNLNPTDGVLQKTGKDDKHYTWWRTNQFDINSAKMIKNGNADDN